MFRRKKEWKTHWNLELMMGGEKREIVEDSFDKNKI
jgi:hypothetical protein